MSKLTDHVENARKNALIPALNDIHQGLVKFRLLGLHMIDELDKRIMKDFESMADSIEAEILRLSNPESKEGKIE